MWRDRLEQALVTIGNHIAPPRCLRCLVAGQWLCDACQLHISQEQNRPPCVGCGKDAIGSKLCSRCAPNYALSGCVSAASYQAQWAQRGIRWLKFRGVHGVVQPLALQVIPLLLAIAPIERLAETAVLSPIPLHPRRLRQRGFNQAALIAQELSKLTTIPYHDYLRRPKATFAMSSLPNTVRSQNIANAFSIEERPPPDRRFILLVDDVTTTGSTLNEAATTIKRVIPSIAVWGVTIARG